MNTIRSYAWLLLALLISAMPSLNCLPPIMPYIEFGMWAGGSFYPITMPNNTLALEGHIQESYPTERSVDSQRWVVMDGPGDVFFEDEHDLRTNATFSETGIYTLRLIVSTITVDTGFWEWYSDDVTVAVIPENGVLLVVYRGDACPDEYIVMEEEGPLELTQDGCVLALREGSYSERYDVRAHTTFEVYLDPTVPGNFNGVIFEGPCGHYAENREGVAINYVDGEEITYEFTTNEQGQFTVTLEPDDYTTFWLKTDMPDYPLDGVGSSREPSGYADFSTIRRSVCRE